MEIKATYKVKDLMEMLGVSYSTACRIIRQVKSVSDVLKIRGVILKEDWEAYIRNKAIPGKRGD